MPNNVKASPAIEALIPQDIPPKVKNTAVILYKKIYNLRYLKQARKQSVLYTCLLYAYKYHRLLIEPLMLAKSIPGTTNKDMYKGPRLFHLAMFNLLILCPLCGHIGKFLHECL